MNNAQLYQRSNALQRRDAVQCLEENADKIAWRRTNDRSVDIGCGDGSVTTEVLRTYLPANYGELVGCDLSNDMIKHANQNYKDERTWFTTLDIEGKLPIDFQGAFDHAFSFFALHWIKDQKRAFTNIFDMLRENGECLLMFPGHMPIYDIYRALASEKRWRPWLHDVERYVSPYHDSQRPQREIELMLKEIGFKNIDVKCRQRSFLYDSVEAVKKAVQAVNPFAIPDELYDDFMEDYLEVLRDMRLMDEYNNNVDEKVSVKAQYTLIVVHAKKC